jgi:hypothetical protein
LSTRVYGALSQSVLYQKDITMFNAFKMVGKLTGETKAIKIALVANKITKRHRPTAKVAAHATDYLLCIQTSSPFCSECCELIIGQHANPAIHDDCAADIAWYEDFLAQCAAEEAAHLAEMQTYKAEEDTVIAQLEAEFASLSDEEN